MLYSILYTILHVDSLTGLYFIKILPETCFFRFGLFFFFGKRTRKREVQGENERKRWKKVIKRHIEAT